MLRSMTTCAALILVVTTGSSFAQGPTRAVPREFDNVRTLGRALSEFRDDRIQVAAAYYYSQYYRREYADYYVTAGRS